MLFMQAESILTQAKEMFIRSYEHIRVTHQKFYQQLLKYQYDKQTILAKIINVSQAQEIILIELCTVCENLQIGEMGKFAMKMHLQNVQIVKWILQNSPSFGQCVSSPTQNVKRGSAKLSPRKQRFQEEQRPSHHFYRMKQNSLFMAEGISKEISQMQNTIDNQLNYQRVEIDNILQNREIVQRIQPSDNEHLLFEAVDIIAHQSEVFKKLAQDNKETFSSTCKKLNLKPYSKLKVQIDEEMKAKVTKANEKLFLTLDRFIVKKSNQQRNSVNNISVEVQVDFAQHIEEKFVMEQKKKMQKIKQLTQSLNQQKTKVEKLQILLKQKVKYFQEKLIKTRFQKNKDNQIALLKKSLTEVTSLNNFKSEAEDDGVQNKNDENAQPIKKSHKYNKGGKLNKKQLQLKGSEQAAYQKTLLRIKFNIQDDLNEEVSSESEIIKGFKIFNEETSFCYNPKETSLTKNLSCRSIEQYKSFVKSRFSFCHNVYDYGIKKSQQQLNKNPSLLTITNIKQAMGRKDENEGRLIKVSHSADRSSFTNLNSFGPKKAKKILKPHQFFKAERENQTEIDQVVDQIGNKFTQIIEYGGEKGKENFEILQLSSEIYAKNKSRINIMMNQLKKKRYRTGNTEHRISRNQNQVYQSQIDPATLLQLYLSEENAMEAQLEFSVSTAMLIEDRKNYQSLTNQNRSSLNQIDDYCDSMCKKILKAIYFRKKNTRVNIQIQNAIKHPFSIIKGAFLCKSQAREFLSQQQIKNFVRFITNLHVNCENKPCLHLTQFLIKIGLNFT